MISTAENLQELSSQMTMIVTPWIICICYLILKYMIMILRESSQILEKLLVSRNSLRMLDSCVDFDRVNRIQVMTANVDYFWTTIFKMIWALTEWSGFLLLLQTLDKACPGVWVQKIVGRLHILILVLTSLHLFVVSSAGYIRSHVHVGTSHVVCAYPFI